MSQVMKPDTLYKVQLTEYERGWGQKPWDTLYFDNEAEARQYTTDYNKKHNTLDAAPDWYVRAEYTGKVA